MQTAARFHIGQIVHHRMFDYRGVVVDVDPIRHPLLDAYFSELRDGCYQLRALRN
jgi:heat shock protein HspQ